MGPKAEAVAKTVQRIKQSITEEGATAEVS